MGKRLYRYNGPVMLYNMLVTDHWRGETYASSDEKARSNLTYQYKKQYGLLPTAKITLPGQFEHERLKEEVS